MLAFEAGDGYDASRMLAPRHRALLDAIHPGPWTVALPTVSYALLAREGDAGATALLREACAESRQADGLCGELLRLSDGLRLP